MTTIRDEMEYSNLKSSVEDKSGMIILSIIYLCVFAAAEYLTYYVNVTSGIIFHFICLMSLLVLSAVNNKLTLQRFCLALGLVPFMRIASLFMPARETSEIFWYILTALPIIAAIIALTGKLKLNLDDIGITANQPLAQLLVAITGIGIGLVYYLLLGPEAFNNNLTVQDTLFPAVVLLVFVGFVEELAFRGLLQRELRSLGSWAWIYTALVYAVLQIGRGTPLYSLLTLVTGFYFGWIARKTGSILGVSLAHGLLNIGLLLIFPHLF